MNIKLLSAVTVFSLSFSAAQPYDKKDIESAMHISAAASIPGSILKVLVGEDKDHASYHSLATIGNITFEVTSAAIESGNSFIMYRNILDAIARAKDDGILKNNWDTDKGMTVAAAVASQVAIEMGLNVVGGVVGNAFKGDDKRVIRRIARSVTFALYVALVAEGENFVKRKLIEGNDYSFKRQFTTLGEESFLTTFIGGVAMNAAHETAGEILIRNANDGTTSDFSISKIVDSVKDVVMHDKSVDNKAEVQADNKAPEVQKEATKEVVAVDERTVENKERSVQTVDAPETNNEIDIAQAIANLTASLEKDQD